MAKWVTEHLEELLQQINEVPFTDDRDKLQLTILMNGFAQMNNKALDNAASRTRSQISEWTLEKEAEAKRKAKRIEKNDSAADELTRLRPIR